MPLSDNTIHELPFLRDKLGVFRDRTHAGEILAGMLEGLRLDHGLVLGIPAGGVPVAVEIARRLGLELDVAVVNKILLPWTTEAGYGAVAGDGSVWIDRNAVADYGLSEREVAQATQQAQAKVLRRVKRFRAGHPFPQAEGRTVILADDGIAAGSTMRTAVAALCKQGAARIVVAVPTGHYVPVQALAAQADDLYCANIRYGTGFAVADAYQTWSDLSEHEVADILHRFAQRQAPPQGNKGDREGWE